MPAVEVEAAFGLDPPRILAKASATEDYARTLLVRAAEAEEDETTAANIRVRAASALTTAGSLWSLIDANRATAMFAESATINYSVGSPYGAFLQICARPSEADPSTQNWSVGAGLASAGILASVWPIVTRQIDVRLDQVLEDVPLLRQVPAARATGRLRIPFSYFSNLAYELDHLRWSTDAPRALDATQAFLRRGAETIEAAREDRFHWQSLRSPMLPAEPEALAGLTLVEQTARETWNESAAVMLDLNPGTLPGALLATAQNLLDASSEAGTDLRG